MSIVGRMNPVGFLGSTRIAAVGLNHFTELCKTLRPDLIQLKSLNRSAAGLNHPAKLLPTECCSSLVYYSIPGGNVGSKACVCTRHSL